MRTELRRINLVGIARNLHGTRGYVFSRQIFRKKHDIFGSVGSLEFRSPRLHHSPPQNHLITRMQNELYDLLRGNSKSLSVEKESNPARLVHCVMKNWVIYLADTFTLCSACETSKLKIQETEEIKNDLSSPVPCVRTWQRNAYANFIQRQICAVEAFTTFNERNFRV